MRAERLEYTKAVDLSISSGIVNRSDTIPSTHVESAFPTQLVEGAKASVVPVDSGKVNRSSHENARLRKEYIRC